MSTFGDRGQRLWDELEGQVDGERGLVLLDEACRIADRLDRLDELLRGDTDVWCRLVHDARTQDYELRIDAALVEARQQAGVLRQILTSLPVKELDDGNDDDGFLDEVRTPVGHPTDAG